MTGLRQNLSVPISPTQGGTGVSNNAASTITITGSFGTTFTVSGATSLTLPTSGTVTALGNATTGSGSIVLATSPTLTTPTLGVAVATSINKVALTAPATSSTLTVADGKTLTASNTLTLTGADGSSVNFGTGGTVLYSGGSYVSSLTGTANQITVSASTGAVTLSLPTDVTISGVITAASHVPTGSSVPTNGMYLSAANQVGFATSSTARWNIAASSGDFLSNTATGPRITAAAPSATVPSVIPNRGDTTTGLGAQAAGNLSAIVGGAEVGRFTSTGLNNVNIGATTVGTGAFSTGSFTGILTTQSGIVRKTRVVTASGAVTVAITDDIVIVAKTVGAPTTVNLPSSPATGTVFTVKDGKGDAATNNLTITPAAGNIDGLSTYVMNSNYQSTTLVYGGTEWSIV